MQLEFSVSDLFETMVDLCFFTDVIIQFRLAYFVYGARALEQGLGLGFWVGREVAGCVGAGGLQGCSFV